MRFLRLLRGKQVMTIMSFIVTLQVINISIDPTDVNPASEDLSVNDIESCIELILEVVLDKSDAVTETDEQDGSSHKPHSSLTLFSIDQSFTLNDTGFEFVSSRRVDPIALSFNSLTISILAPPPRHA